MTNNKFLQMINTIQPAYTKYRSTAPYHSPAPSSLLPPLPFQINHHEDQVTTILEVDSVSHRDAVKDEFFIRVKNFFFLFELFVYFFFLLFLKKTNLEKSLF